MRGNPTLTVAGSKEEAESQLENAFFDLIVLDLRIPTVTGMLDEDTAHGRTVFYSARKQGPGTPIFVFTGSSAESFIDDFLSESAQVDIWSTGRKIPTVQCLSKIRLLEFKQRLEDICDAVWNLSEVELEGPDTELLPIPLDRLVRIFTRKYGAVRCELQPVGGGLSSAKVFRARITDSHGVTTIHAIAKLSSIDDVRAEGKRFDTHIARLDASATPRKLCVLEYGAKNKAGVFYSLAAEYIYDGFSLAEAEPVAAPRLPVALTQHFTPWWEDVPQSRKTVKEIRRAILSDEKLTAIVDEFDLPWVRELESRQVQVRWCSTHGDLHGRNILATSSGKCVVIDYGDVGVATAALDPVTYELSLLFHPDGILRNSGWPTPEQATRWGDLERYAAQCPHEALLRALRVWAQEVAAGRREIAATAYAYLIRQLRYSDTDKDLILALLQGVREVFTST